jgi:hypothetical protein
VFEDAVRAATGEQIGWPALSRAAGAALRVVADAADERVAGRGLDGTALQHVA